MTDQYDGPLMAQQILQLRTERDALKAERDAAAKLEQYYAQEAYDDVLSWGAYVSKHFQRKWNFDGDLAKWFARWNGQTAREVRYD